MRAKKINLSLNYLKNNDAKLKKLKINQKNFMKYNLSSLPYTKITIIVKQVKDHNNSLDKKFNDLTK